MHAVLQRTKKGNVIETAEDEIEFQRGVNDGHYAIVMGTATFVFWSTLIPGLLVQDDPHKVVPFGNAIKTVAFLLVVMYYLELTTHNSGWMSVLHHSLAIIQVVYVVDFTKSAAEIRLGLVYLAYILSEVNIYFSLWFHFMAKYIDSWKKPAQQMTRASVYIQSIASVTAQVACLTLIATEWHQLSRDYKVLFLLSDAFWVLEQAYCINRSCASLEKKLHQEGRANNIIEQAIFKVTLPAVRVVGCSCMVALRKRRRGYSSSKTPHSKLPEQTEVEISLVSELSEDGLHGTNLLKTTIQQPEES